MEVLINIAIVLTTLVLTVLPFAQQDVKMKGMEEEINLMKHYWVVVVVFILLWVIKFYEAQ